MASERIEKLMDYPEQVNPNPSFLNLRQATSFTQDQSEAFFNSLPRVNAREIEGPYKGKLFSIKGTGGLPVTIRKGLIAILHTPLAVWAGKCFSNGEGSNLWFSKNWGVKFGHFTVKGNTETGEIECLDYEIDKNFSLLKPIYGEVRKLGNGLFFCRMMYRTAKKDYCLLYFSLSEL